MGIDPGTTTSGICLYDLRANRVEWSDKAMPTDQIILAIRTHASLRDVEIALERIEALYGGTIGKETVKTIQLCGRIIQCAWPRTIHCLSPAEVRMAVCGTAKAKDPGVNQALIDKIGPKGTKKAPGPTAGVSSHAWRALAVAYASTLAPTHPE